jgi:hypothetical protein
MDLKVIKFVQIKEKDSAGMTNDPFQCEDCSLCLNLPSIDFNDANKSKLLTLNQLIYCFFFISSY